MQKFKILILSLLIGANLQAQDTVISFTQNGKVESNLQKDKVNQEIMTKVRERSEEFKRQAAILSNLDYNSLTDEQKKFLDYSRLTDEQKLLVRQEKKKNAQPPQWFYNLVAEEGQTIGYGTSEDYSEAYALAHADIAKQLSGSILSEDTSKKSEINGEYSNSFTSEVKIKTEKLDTRSFEELKCAWANGVWFYAASYDARELSEKIISLKNKLVPTNNPNYLNYSKFGINLNDILGFDPEMSISFQDKFAFLNIGGKKIPISEYEIGELFSRTSTGTISSSLSKKRYRYGERVDLTINSNKPGYISVLWVSEYGETGIIRENEEIYNSITVMENKNKVGIRPGFSGENKELLVTIFSETPIDIDSFKYEKEVTDTLRNSYKQKSTQYKFHKLIKFMTKYQTCTSVANISSLKENLKNPGRQLSFDETGVVFED